MNSNLEIDWSFLIKFEMKNFIIYFLITSSIFISAQEIVYNPVLISPCNNQKIDFYRYQFSMKDESGKYFMSKMNDTSLILPKKGLYRLDIAAFDSPYFVNIDKNGVISDTFFKNEFSQKEKLISNCGKPIDGDFVSYYKRNQIRLKGKFSNGVLLDSLKKFYENGVLNSVLVMDNKLKKRNWYIEYFRNGKIKTSFDAQKRENFQYNEQGNLILDLRWENLNDYSRKKYYDNGQLESVINFSEGKYYTLNGSLKVSVKLGGENIYTLTHYDSISTPILKVVYQQDFTFYQFHDHHVKEFYNDFIQVPFEDISQIVVTDLTKKQYEIWKSGSGMFKIYALEVKTKKLLKEVDSFGLREFFQTIQINFFN